MEEDQMNLQCRGLSPAGVATGFPPTLRCADHRSRLLRLGVAGVAHAG
jgi:hypothetical protein